MIQSDYKSESEILEKLNTLSESQRKKMLFLTASKGKLKLFKILLNNFEYSDLKWDLFINICIRNKKDNVLTFISKIHPQRVLEKMIQMGVAGWRIEEIYTQLDYDKKSQIDQEILVKIASVIKSPELFELGTFAPRIALQEIINQKNIREISTFLGNYHQNLDTNEKKIIYKSLIKFYIDDLVDNRLIMSLTRDFSSKELQEFQEYKSSVLDVQCQLCMDKVRECFFNCADAKKFGHGVCKDCYKVVSSSENRICPWCRHPMRVRRLGIQYLF